MQKKASFAASVAYSLLVCGPLLPSLLCSPQSPAPVPISPTAVGELMIDSAEVPGWAPSSANGDTFCSYPIDSFYSKEPGAIDGGAVVYDSVGCKQIAFQMLTGPDPEIYSSHAMDFATPAKALAMFDYSRSLWDSLLSVPTFDGSTAVARTVMNGVVAYAHFNKFYFEITLLGFTDRPAALSTAGTFLNAFERKIK